jgi:hypothetical protein
VTSNAHKKSPALAGLLGDTATGIRTRVTAVRVPFRVARPFPKLPVFQAERAQADTLRHAVYRARVHAGYTVGASLALRPRAVVALPGGATTPRRAGTS